MSKGFARQPKVGFGAHNNHWCTGVGEIDKCLPKYGLNRTGLHEIVPMCSTEMPSLTGFALGLLSRLRSSQPIIWCVTANQIGEHGHPYACGLEPYGISAAQVIFTKVAKVTDLQFAMEEALKVEGVIAVLGEGGRPSFTGSRRLSLLCKNYQKPCLLLSADKEASFGSAALTRWQIKPDLGVKNSRDPFGPGLPTWRVALPRVRGGQAMPPLDKLPTKNHINAFSRTEHISTYPWRVIWDDQTLSFDSASVFARRALLEKRVYKFGRANVAVGA